VPEFTFTFTFTFTKAEQEAEYAGSTTNYIVCEVGEHIVAADNDGPAVEFNVSALPVGGLPAPIGLAARKCSNVRPMDTPFST